MSIRKPHPLTHISLSELLRVRKYPGCERMSPALFSFKLILDKFDLFVYIIGR